MRFNLAKLPGRNAAQVRINELIDAVRSLQPSRAPGVLTSHTTNGIFRRSIPANDEPEANPKRRALEDDEPQNDDNLGGYDYATWNVLADFPGFEVSRRLDDADLPDGADPESIEQHPQHASLGLLRVADGIERPYLWLKDEAGSLQAYPTKVDVAGLIVWHSVDVAGAVPVKVRPWKMTVNGVVRLVDLGSGLPYSAP